MHPGSWKSSIWVFLVINGYHISLLSKGAGVKFPKNRAGDRKYKNFSGREGGEIFFFIFIFSLLAIIVTDTAFKV